MGSLVTRLPMLLFKEDYSESVRLSLILRTNLRLTSILKIASGGGRKSYKVGIDATVTIFTLLGIKYYYVFTKTMVLKRYDMIILLATISFTGSSQKLRASKFYFVPKIISSDIVSEGFYPSGRHPRFRNLFLERGSSYFGNSVVSQSYISKLCNQIYFKVFTVVPFVIILN